MALKSRDEAPKKKVIEDDEEEVVVRKKKHAKDPEWLEEEGEEEDSSDDFFNERLTPADVKAALSNPDLIPPGEYELEITGHRLVEPKKFDDGGESAGGIEIRFKVIEAPSNVKPPEEGWGRPKVFFRKWRKPTEGQQTAMRIDKQNLLRLIVAALGSWDNEMDLLDAVKELKGNKVIARISHSEYNGQTQQNVGSFKEA